MDNYFATSNVPSDQDNLDTCEEGSNVLFWKAIDCRVFHKVLNLKQINLRP